MIMRVRLMQANLRISRCACELFASNYVNYTLSAWPKAGPVVNSSGCVWTSSFRAYLTLRTYKHILGHESQELAPQNKSCAVGCSYT